MRAVSRKEEGKTIRGAGKKEKGRQRITF